MYKIFVFQIGYDPNLDFLILIISVICKVCVGLREETGYVCVFTSYRKLKRQYFTPKNFVFLIEYNTKGLVNESALRTFVNGPFYESFNITFMGNIKRCKKSQLLFSFPIKSF